MKFTFSSRRSASPFGTTEGPLLMGERVFSDLKNAVDAAFEIKEEKAPKKFTLIEDIVYVPARLEKISLAPANDAPELDPLIAFLMRFRETWEEKGLSSLLYKSMLRLFEIKTELFLIDHQDKEHCEKLGLSEPYRNLVLFSKERDAIVGRYIAPCTESSPGLFSEFVNTWVKSENADRLLHLLDFCSGSKRPTFEHYLLFINPSLNRIVSNKSTLQFLFEKAKSVSSKLVSPTWESDVRALLNLS